VAQFAGTMDDVRLRKDVIRILTEGFKKVMGLTSSPASEESSRREPGRGMSARSSRAQARGLAETIETSNWSERSQEILETEIHHQLADLPLPLYLTTNIDNFMALALEAQKSCKSVRRESIQWHRPPQEAQYPDLDPPPDKEHLEHPVVLHLFGTEDDPSSMVLTQDNYLDYLARISRDHEFLLPPSVAAALTQNTLLFLGYHLDSLDLKVIMRGLLTQLDLKRWDRLRVIVQLESWPDKQDEQEEVVQYLRKYFAKSQEAQIDVYWGSTRQFVADLHSRWQGYQEERNGKA
jgi:hypothetical protein